MGAAKRVGEYGTLGFMGSCFALIGFAAATASFPPLALVERIVLPTLFSTIMASHGISLVALAIDSFSENDTLVLGRPLFFFDPAMGDDDEGADCWTATFT